MSRRWMIVILIALPLLIVGIRTLIQPTSPVEVETQGTQASVPERLSVTPQPAQRGGEFRGTDNPIVFTEGPFKLVVSDVRWWERVAADHRDQKLYWARNSYLTMHVVLVNVGKKPEHALVPMVRDGDGRTFSFVYLDGVHNQLADNSATFLGEVNPKTQLRGMLIFDVPKEDGYSICVADGLGQCRGKGELLPLPPAIGATANIINIRD